MSRWRGWEEGSCRLVHQLCQLGMKGLWGPLGELPAHRWKVLGEWRLTPDSNLENLTVRDSSRRSLEQGQLGGTARVPDLLQAKEDFVSLDASVDYTHGHSTGGAQRGHRKVRHWKGGGSHTISLLDT